MEALQEIQVVSLEDPLEPDTIKSQIIGSRSKINLLTQSIKKIYVNIIYQLSLKRFEYNEEDLNNENSDQEEKTEYEYTSGS